MTKSGILAVRSALSARSALALVVIGTVLLSITGITVVPLILLTALLYWVFFASKYAKLFSFAAAIVAVLFIFIVTIYLGRLTTIPVDILTSGVYGLTGLILVWFIPVNTYQLGTSVKSTWKTGLPMAAVPATITGFSLWIGGVINGTPKIAWVMSGDAQTNTVLAREVLKNHGESLGKTATFTQDVLALAMSIGREEIPSTQLLTHDLMKISETWASMILLSSLLMGLIAWGMLRKNRHLILVNVVVFLAAVYPLSWYVNGFAIMFGFINVSLATLLLSLAWLIWQQGSNALLVGTSLQLLLGVLFLATWPPLVVIPLGLALGMLAKSFRHKFTKVDVAGLSLSVLSFAVFAAVVIAPSLIRNGNGLQLDGSILDYRWTTFLLVVFFSLFACFAVKGALPNGNYVALGLLIIAGSSTAGLVVLLWGNRNLDSTWIYYPIKFAWVSGAFVLILSVIAFASFVLNREKAPEVILGLVGVFGILGSFMLMNSVPRWQVLPLTRVAFATDPNEEMLPFVSEWAGTKSIFSHFKSTDEDLSGNQWLYHMAVETITDPIRDLAFHPPKTVDEFCVALETLGPTATLITSDSDWATTIQNNCVTSGGFEIEVQKVN